MDYRHLITIEPDKRSGQPCIRGLPMTVQDVLEYLAGGMSAEEILADFPDLTAEDIRACLAFAADREQRRRVLAHSPKFQALLDKSRRQIEETGGIPHDRFWSEVAAENREGTKKAKPQARRKKQ